MAAPDTAKSGPHEGAASSNAASKDLWELALSRLEEDDRKQFDNCETNMLEVLQGVAAETEIGKERCTKDDWKPFKDKKGINFRHVLEKISVWVNQLISVIDFGVSFDASGHAALPWGVIKFLITAGTNDVKVFNNMAEGVEKISGLITRYNIFEKLYTSQECESTPKLLDSLKTLYTAMLVYLATAKKYFDSNILGKLGRGLRDMVTQRYDELLASISETQVDKWAKLVDVELQRKMAKDASEDYKKLKDKLHELNQPIVQMSDKISIIADKFQQYERKEVFEWMSKIDYWSHHRFAQTGILPGSGKWLVDNDQFTSWGQSSVSSIFLLYGIPGSGKTGLVSTVINNLQTSLGSRESPIAFFYCQRNDNEPERAKPVEILCALLRQLASSKPDLPIREPVATEYRTRKQKADKDCSKLEPLTIEKCTELILKLTLNSPATIVIDALDECDSATRYDLFKALSKIVNDSEEVVKVFLTSRGDHDIHLYFKEYSHIFIDSNNDHDIAQFVKTEVERYHAEKRLLYGKTDKKFRRKLIKKLSEGARGMFQWVVLSLEALYPITDEKDFVRALGNLPPKLEDLYEKIYSKIEKPGTHQYEIVVKTFKWLLCAQRMLSIEELIAAVTSDYDMKATELFDSSSDSGSDSESDSEPTVERESIEKNDEGPGPLFIQSCRNLVIIDAEQGAFRFAHQSVREYLILRAEYAPLQLHLGAIERCLDVYLDDLLPSIPPAMIQHNKTLRPYAKIYWPVHYMAVERDLSVNVKSKVSQFIGKDQSNFPAYTTWASEISSEYDPNYGLSLNESVMVESCKRLGYRLLSATQSPSIPLRAAAAFGFLSFFEELEGQGHDIRKECNSGTFDLLHIAAAEGHEEIVDRLLSNGIDVAIKDSNRRTALHWAVRNGHENVAFKILSKMTPDDLVSSGKFTGTVLHEATRHNSSTDLIQQLLQKMRPETIIANDYVLGAGQNQELAEVSLSTRETGGVYLANMTALHLAASHDNERIVKLLLARMDPVSVGAVDDRMLRRTALFIAAREGNERIVRLLMQKMNVPDIEKKCHGERTALYVAAENGHAGVVKVLLEKIGHKSIMTPDGIDGTPLHRASAIGNETTVRLLLEKIGSDGIMRFDIYAMTPLHYAIENGHKEVVRLLLKYITPKDVVAIDHTYDDIDINIEIETGKSALDLASENKHEEIVKMLTEKLGQAEI